MFSRIKKVARNHWKKVVIGGAAVQVMAYGAKYAANRFVEYHESKAKELWQKMRKHQHFESMEGTYFTTYVALLPTLKSTVIGCLDSEPLTEILKSGIPNKLEIWQELKVIGFSRIIVTIYGTSLLNILLRIQLSVIGGYLFQETGVGGKEPAWRNVSGVILSNVTAIDMELQQKYLSLANHLVTKGMEKLSEYVYNKTKTVVEPLSLKQKITISDLEQIFLKIVAAVNRDIFPEPGTTNAENGSPVKYPWKYIYPDDILETHNYFQNTAQTCRPHYVPPDMHERLMCETFDLLDSDDVCGLLNSFESQGISHFCDRIADYVTQTCPPTAPSTEVSPEGELENGSVLSAQFPVQHHQIFSEVEVPVAKIIPMLNSLIGSGIKETDPWIALLTSSESVRTLAANVYESFSTSASEY